MLQLSTNKQLSPLICSTCIQSLRDANRFRMMVVNAEQRLLTNMLDKETVFINGKFYLSVIQCDRFKEKC